MSDHGRFIWYELMTPDIAAARVFYREVVGWTVNEMTMPGGGEPYTIFEAGAAGVAGGFTLGAEHRAQGIPPNWTGYVAVDDCDAAAARVKALGGAVEKPPEDIPGIGRFAVVADPTGAVIAIMTPAPMDAPPPQPPAGAPGTAGWHELYAGKLETAWAFYEALFGWTKDEAFDMGPQVGVYQLFANADGRVGGMMTRNDDVPAPCWNYYFRVDGIDAAEARVRGAGGQVIMGPMEVPGGDWVLSALDPQGAMFSLLSAGR